MALTVLATGAPTVFAQTAEEIQIQSARDTDTRVLAQVAEFRAALEKRFGRDVRLGRVEITDGRIRANVAATEGWTGTQFMGGKLETGSKHRLDELGGAPPPADHSFSLSVLAEDRLLPWLQAAHAGPDRKIAHVYNIELAYFPAPLGREVVAVGLIGLRGMLKSSFDVATGDPIDLEKRMAAVASDREKKAAAATRSSSSADWSLSGLLARLPDATAALAAELPGASFFGIDVSEGSIRFAVASGKKQQTFWTWDRRGLRSEYDMPLLPGTCKKPFSAAEFDPGAVAGSDATALAASPIPDGRVKAAEIRRGAGCQAPVVAFEIQNARGYADVSVDMAGRVVAAERR